MRNEINELRENTDMLKLMMSQEGTENSDLYDRVDYWIDINKLIISERLCLDENQMQARIEKTEELISQMSF